MHRSLRWLLDDAYDAWLRVDEQGAVIEWPHTAARFFALEERLAIGHPVTMALGLGEWALPERPRHLDENPARACFELRFERVDGRAGFLELTAVVEREGGWLLLVKEITARKRVEEMERREHRLHTALAEMLNLVLLPLSPEQLAGAVLDGLLGSHLLALEPRGAVLLRAASGGLVLAAARPDDAQARERWQRAADAALPLLARAAPPTECIETAEYCWAPLFSDGELIGAIALRPERKSDAGEEGAVLLTAVADAMAGALGRRMAEERLHSVVANLNSTVAELAFYRRALDAWAILSIADAAGLIVHANDRFCAATGYDRSELIGQNHRVINSRFHPPEFFAGLWQTIAAGRIWTGEIKERRKDGSTFWVDCTIVPFLSGSGRPERYLAMRSDITARKEAQEALMLSQRELAEAQRIARMGRWEWGIAEVRFTWSREAADIFEARPSGDGRRDLKRFLQRVHPEDRSSLHYHIKHALRNRADFRLDYRIVLDKGELRHVHVQGVVKCKDDGKPERMVGTVQDVTERKRVEEKLEAVVAEQWKLNQRLKETQDQLLQSEKMASIGQLAAGVAHEINNPVGYVSSNLSSMSQYLDDLLALIDLYGESDGVLPPELRERVCELKARIDLAYLRSDLMDLLGETREGVARVRQIVQDLKDFSHVDEGEWQWEEIARGLDSTLNIVHNELKYKATVLKEYGELPPVCCLGAQLNQVFMNLLVNAGHAISDHGTITIRTGTNGPDWVFVEVSDTGCGIPPDHLSRVFDPFFTTKPVGQGTGLGLSLAYSIVKKHNGRIEVESEVDKGTTFRVLIPVNRESEPCAAA